MKFFDDIKKDAMLFEGEKQQEKINRLNKTLYNSDIIQELYNTINALEKRIEKLEER